MGLPGSAFKQGEWMDNVFRRYWTDREQSKLLALVRSRSSLYAQRDAASLLCLIATGCRIGEFLLLNVQDAKDALESRWLFLPREIRKGKRVDHQVPVTKPVEDSLHQLLRLHSKLGGSGLPDAPLVLSRKNLRMSVRGFQFKVAQWCEQAGIDGTPHFARHTRAMSIKLKSTSPDWRGIVKSTLGHSTLESSAVYTAVSKEDLERELAAIDGPARVRKQDLRKRYDERRAS